jgi:hypothetical protein
VELEGERLAFFELYVVGVGLGDGLELFGLEHGLVRFAHERFERFLLDFVGESFLDDGGWCLAWAEPGEANLAGDALGGALLGFSDAGGGD